MAVSRKSNLYPRAWKDGKAVFVHRLVVEETLERTLEPREVIHHINGDKEDNRLENIRVLPSQRHHMVLEHLERRRARGVEALFEDEEILDKVEK